MNTYRFYWKGNFYTVESTTVEGALNQIRHFFSAACARECWIVDVTPVDTSDLVVAD